MANVLTNPFPPAVFPYIPTAGQITDMQSRLTGMVVGKGNALTTVAGVQANHHVESVFKYLLANFPTRWTDNAHDLAVVHYNYKTN